MVFYSRLEETRIVIPFGLGVPENHVNVKKCDHVCNWWAHNRFIHIHYENSDTGKISLEKWAKPFFPAQIT